MAKGKKQSISADELMEQALVPENERPYEVPMNWVWTELKHVCTFQGGGTPSKANEAYWNGGIPWASVKDIKGDYLFDTVDSISESGVKDSATNLCKIGDVILATRIEPGKTIISRIEAAINQDLKIVKSDLNGAFLHYYFQTFRQEFIKKSSGSTVLGITLPNVSNTLIPLPPLLEQQRIVDRIESLFAKLDQAKELVQNALDSFEARKAAILHKAFTGELTARWRVEHGTGVDSWGKKKLNEVAKFSAGYAFDSKSFTQKGYQVIRMGNLYNGVLDLERNPVFIDSEVLDESLLNKSRIEKGDILLTLTGTKYKRDYGFAVLIDQDKILLLNQRIVALTPNQVDPIFLLYFLRSNLFRDVFFSNETGGVNQGNVSSKFVENILMPYPSLHEQKQIVSILVNVLSKEDKTKELIDVIDQIDGMKKAILARGFRGELGTNDPGEESSEKLLIESLEKKINESVTVNKRSPNNESIDVGKVRKLDNKDLLNLLNQYGGKLTPIELYKKTELGIEEFYAVLKEYVNIGDIVEDRRNNGEVYLVAKR
jgi:type I restriction enzyme S subunit